MLAADDWAGALPETAATRLEAQAFDSAAAERRLCALFKVASLDGFGAFGRADLGAMGALVSYLDHTQQGRLPFLQPPQREETGEAMQIDAATRRNLEITAALSGGREGSLLGAVDRTLTAAGARLLERRLAAPSRDPATIRARLAGVRHLVADSRLREAARAALRRTPDMDRALSRLGLDRGGPRDLAAIRTGIGQAARLAALLAEAEGDALPDALAQAQARLGSHTDLGPLLDRALAEEVPIALRDGGLIAAGHDPDLDETRRLRDASRAVIAGMQADYAGLAGIPALRIRHNGVLGYFVDVTATHAARMMAPPLSETFIHRQTTAGQVRFTTPDLSAIEVRILEAAERAQEIERAHFQALRAAVLSAAGLLAETARALAEVDLAAALADLAAAEGWVEPVVDDSRAFRITGGRHPVVERALRRDGGPAFVANDCDLTAEAGTEAVDGTGAGAALVVLTGPNMAGKSTYLRQNALIALLAQSGSFVPAASAHIGIVSQLFSRVGASDDLARGRSTFMVEMVETAAILNRADDRALVILDEIGRGTATWDGLSIAWATLEHLHDVNRCRGLFATHYHEMTALARKLSGVRNATMRVREWEGDVIFLHEVAAGAADRSYGVQVARLAGLPDAVIARARAVLAALETGGAKRARGRAERRRGGRRRPWRQQDGRVHRRPAAVSHAARAAPPGALADPCPAGRGPARPPDADGGAGAGLRPQGDARGLGRPSPRAWTTRRHAPGAAGGRAA